MDLVFLLVGSFMGVLLAPLLGIAANGTVITVLVVMAIVLAAFLNSQGKTKAAVYIILALLAFMLIFPLL